MLLPEKSTMKYHQNNNFPRNIQMWKDSILKYVEYIEYSISSSVDRICYMDNNIETLKTFSYASKC